jgi:predicted transcriptional regulator
MTAEVRTCEGEQRVNDLMQVITEHRIRHLPVMNGDELVGIISIGDVVKSRLGELEFERDQLDSYIHTAQS